MRFAVLTEDQEFVDNVIVANEDQKEELEAALGRNLLDAAPLGLLPVGVSADVAEALAILNGEEEGNADAE